MPRGRHKSIALKEEGEDFDLVDEISSIIHESCSIPGCSLRWHKEEALRIVNLLKSKELLRNGSELK